MFITFNPSVYFTFVFCMRLFNKCNVTMPKKIKEARKRNRPILPIKPPINIHIYLGMKMVP